ncbi:tyrosine-type recombinase/integrase [Desulfovibrio litoralis]|uniref:Site-specific recombinase XerD n=1 Tax=Desulfovibrio litoralis DSM 11393 TaxID=1121455 RepID=A0A1M7TPW0_9BACT|nr:site-specific integrase [Desulfovibrio litoralis]SHN72781.1 Site-specific recombinase XerD [Desulfovibrio litoralis DSM 11393]
MKREKTKYPGVYFRLQKKIGSEVLERSYYIMYRIGGRGSKLIEEPVGKESEDMTPARANFIRSDRMRGKELSNVEQRKAQEEAILAESSRPIISRLWTLYNEDKPDRKVKKTDTYFYQKHLEKYFGDKEPSEIVTLDIDRMRLRLLKTLSPQTVKHILSLLRRLIRFGVIKGLCNQPEPSRQHFTFPIVDNQKTETLTQQQFESFMTALNEEEDQNLAAFMRLALVTGMRKGALMALQWTDIDFEQGFITLRGTVAKNGKTERIPISEPTRIILENIDVRNSLFVFPGKNGGQRKDFKRVAKRIKEKAGLPKDFRPLHGLRHTYASWLASSGKVDLYTLQKLLTHSSPQMTQRYAHLADEALQRAATVAGELFSEKQKRKPI